MTRSLHRDPDRRCMPVSEWPTADRALWEAALVPGDVLDEGGVLARHAAITKRNLAKGYGRWLTWLAQSDLLDHSAPPADRITPERVKAYGAHLRTINATATQSASLRELHDSALAMDAGRDWSWIRRIRSCVRAKHVPARRKRSRLVGAADLLALGEQLMQSAPAQSTDRLRAIQFRDGLIIALLAARPLRRRNLAGIELGRTLVRRGECWWIAIPAEEAKTREPIEVPWPEVLNSALGMYLQQHRPVLCRLRGRWTRPVGGALWVSADGSPMSQGRIYDSIIRRTRVVFGHSINPHLFRDCAATSIAIEDPAHVHIASQILGHRSAATTEKYYNQAQAIDAARRYQDFLVGLRNGRMTEDSELKDS